MAGDVPSQMLVIARSQLNESDQLLTAAAWVLVMVIWPPKPLPQSLVSANAAEVSSARSSSRSRPPWPIRTDARRPPLRVEIRCDPSRSARMFSLLP